MWKKTTGTVIDSSMGSGFAQDTMRTHVYMPTITYQYEVGGQVYTNNRLHRTFSPGSSFQGLAKRLNKIYPSGESVTVYYNESNPAQSALLMGLGGTVRLFYYFIGVIGCSLLTLLFVGLTIMMIAIVVGIAIGFSFL